MRNKRKQKKTKEKRKKISFNIVLSEIKITKVKAQ